MKSTFTKGLLFVSMLRGVTMCTSQSILRTWSVIFISLLALSSSEYFRVKCVRHEFYKHVCHIETATALGIDSLFLP